MIKFFQRNSVNRSHYNHKKPRKIPILRFLVPALIIWAIGTQFGDDNSSKDTDKISSNDSTLVQDSNSKNLTNSAINHKNSKRDKIPEASLTQGALHPNKEISALKIDSSIAQNSDSPEPLVNEEDSTISSDRYEGDQYQADTLMGRQINTYLNRYKPKGAFILIIDAATNEILSWGQRTDGKTQEEPTWLSEPRFPAASLAKTITAAAALDYNRYSNHTKFPKIGNPTKLYKNQLKAPSNYKGPMVSMEQAYAKSYNPIFGMIGQKLGGNLINSMGSKLGMNQTFPNNIPKSSSFDPPLSGYGLAEVASGFTDHTKVSPLHIGAMFRALVEGQALQIPWSKEIPSQYAPSQPLALPNPKLKSNTYLGMKKMMEASVESGTARKWMKKNIFNYHQKRLNIGGKTGTIGGGLDSRVEWFAGFAQDKKNPKKEIIVVVVQEHGKIWTQSAVQISALIINQWAQLRLD